MRSGWKVAVFVDMSEDVGFSGNDFDDLGNTVATYTAIVNNGGNNAPVTGCFSRTVDRLYSITQMKP